MNFFCLIVSISFISCSKIPTKSIQQTLLDDKPNLNEEELATGERIPDPFDESKILGEYYTDFSTVGKGARPKNIEVAAKKINVNMESGAELSFNDAVGPRTQDNEFVEAPVILMGETTEGIGGGVCQVSSTLHAAALMSGLEIISRRSHSRPSKYIKVGLDSTVAYPPECNGNHRENLINGKNKECDSIDLVLKNPFPFMIGIRTRIEDSAKGKNRLTVSIVGNDPVVEKVDYIFQSNRGEDFEKKIRKAIRIIPATYKHRIQPGQAGSHVLSILRYKMIDGTQKEVRYRSEYPPVNEIWEVGLEFDLSGPPPWDSEIMLQ